METGTAIVLGLAGGAVAWWLLRASGAGGAGVWDPNRNTTIRKQGDPYGPGYTNTTSDLGPLQPVVNSIPGVAQIYPVLAKANDAIVQPLVKGINDSGLVKSINSGIDSVDIQVTQNPDGTITRTVKDPNAYEKYVGEPISKAGTAVIHFIGSLG
jgi:hypothetical protein